MMQCAKRFAVALLLRNRWENVGTECAKTCRWSATRAIHTSSATHEFHEYDKRSGYDTELDYAETRTERIRMALKQLKKEIKLWRDEVKEVLESDPILDYRAGTFSSSYISVTSPCVCLIFSCYFIFYFYRC